jgi:hypothetical protein
LQRTIEQLFAEFEESVGHAKQETNRATNQQPSQRTPGTDAYIRKQLPGRDQLKRGL